VRRGDRLPRDAGGLRAGLDEWASTRAGANRSDQWRYGLFLSYSVGWLRQEKNQYLDVPPELGRTLPRELRELVGYKMDQGLGLADPGA
jgi:hypothetical protein